MPVPAGRRTVRRGWRLCDIVAPDAQRMPTQILDTLLHLGHSLHTLQRLLEQHLLHQPTPLAERQCPKTVINDGEGSCRQCSVATAATGSNLHRLSVGGGGCFRG
uniref:Uncharacterized protein n=1 Tax=Lygus hesperus TaxID=30085 RepID=A0A146KP70_LYGHE